MEPEKYHYTEMLSKIISWFFNTLLQTMINLWILCSSCRENYWYLEIIVGPDGLNLRNYEKFYLDQVSQRIGQGVPRLNHWFPSWFEVWALLGEGGITFGTDSWLAYHWLKDPSPVNSSVRYTFCIYISSLWFGHHQCSGARNIFPQAFIGWGQLFSAPKYSNRQIITIISCGYQQQ